MSTYYFKNCFGYIRHLKVFSRKFSRTIMPPLDQRVQTTNNEIDSFLRNNKVMIFSKSHCPFCQKVKGLFTNLKINYFALELDKMETDAAMLLQETLKARTGQATVPNVFVNGEHIGGCDATFKVHEQNKLLPMIQGSDGSQSEVTVEENHGFDYDLIVIGGGSGGLAASKEAAKLGMKVAVCDFVKPTPIGTTWGLGGTCVNVGCIPKKLMHQGSLLGLSVSDASTFGWNLSEERSHKWDLLVEGIQNYIGSLNWGYRVALKEASVTYLNEFAEFVDQHSLKLTNKKGKVQNISANKFILAVGGRPRYPDIPGAREFCITSDDLFSLPHNPGKTLCIGASYIALECAGFLSGFGIDTTVMVRSILLRGFDQQMAESVGDYMKDHGVKFLREWIPISIEKVKDGNPATLLVKAKSTSTDETLEEEYNTVILAIGRDPCTSELKLANAGVQINAKSGKVLTNSADQSNMSNIFAIGDVAENRPELTPVAIQAGVLLSRRLFGGSNSLMDYDNVPTTVFTPLEYGCIGLSEENAVSRYGEGDVEVYHTNFQPLEFVIPKRDENKCYLKLVCVKSENERVVGFHYLGPNAGEVTQGYGLGMRLGATKSDFDSLVGIHPTCAETFTTLEITKSSGMSSLKKGC